MSPTRARGAAQRWPEAHAQADVVAWLMEPGHLGPGPIDRIDTHASSVFLAGARAFKLKRAVRYEYLDFSTLELRRRCCLEEVALNRRAAPELYLGVRAVTREADGSLALQGPGEPVEWLIEMARFDQEALFDRLAARQALDADLMPALAEAVARFHAGATPRDDHGGRAGMLWVVDGNTRDFDRLGAGWLERDACEDLHAQARAAIERTAPLLEDRRQRGFVRWCHGDLHLRNLVLLDGRPTLFDAVEFNAEIACVDVLYDLAFLLMDLERRGLALHANLAFNEYLAASAADERSLALLPLFLSARAGVRAKTSVTAAALETDSARIEALGSAARDYLARARAFLTPVPPRLLAVGGLSGAGKSALARRLAPSLGAAPGALVLRSDVVRKRLFGRKAHERLDDAAYEPGVSRQVYRAILDRARVAIAAGHSVIVDAAHLEPSTRQAVGDLATALDVPFAGLWMSAPEAVRVERVRQRSDDASDATSEVLARQRVSDPDGISWTQVDATDEPTQLARQVREQLEGFFSSGSA